MTCEELSDDLSSWSIPARRTKNGRAHVVPLPPEAREILASVIGERKGGFVFTTTGSTPVSGFSKMKPKLDKAMLRAAQKDDPRATIEPWRLHDLRRTFATGANEIGVAPHIVEACINHVSGARASVAGVYNKAEDIAEKRVALERWAQHVAAVASPAGRAGNVVTMRKRQSSD